MKDMPLKSLVFNIKQMLTKDFALQFAAVWVAAWNAHDLEEILSHYTDDFEIESPLALKRFPESKGILKGKTAIRKYWGIGLQKNPNLKFEIKEVLIGVHTLTIYYRSIAAQKNVVEILTFGEKGKVEKVVVCYSS